MASIFGSEVHRLKADVAVIGGGTAGLNTALAAAEAGADVLIVDKAHIQRSGAIAGGTISGGMIPKVETRIFALNQGVEGVVIMDGKVPHAILLELLTDHGVGTVMHR